MLWIAHRGNLDGPNPLQENQPDYINTALTKGFDVEIDVWFKNGQLYLGHDEEAVVPLPNFLSSSNYIWFHCKNVEALLFMRKQGNLPWKNKYFWHQTDDYAITSNGHIWTYPGARLVPGAIAVLPEEAFDGELRECSAICTDYIHYFKEAYDKGSNINQRPAPKL